MHIQHICRRESIVGTPSRETYFTMVNVSPAAPAGDAVHNPLPPVQEGRLRRCTLVGLPFRDASGHGTAKWSQRRDAVIDYCAAAAIVKPANTSKVLLAAAAAHSITIN